MYRTVVTQNASIVFLASVALGLMGPSIGCTRAWRPPLDTVRTRELPPVFALAEYLPRASGAEWLYGRFADPQSPNVATSYRRRIVGSDVVEGRFIGQPLSGLASRLANAHRSSPSAPDEIESFFGEKQGFIVTCEPALVLYPQTLASNETFNSETNIRYFDRTGQHRSDGTIAREVRCEGVESVTTPAGTFGNCLRLRVEMTFHIHWGPTVQTTEYIWLAHNIGIVRRIERIAGVIWFFLIDSAAEYVLVAYRPATFAPPPHGDLRLKCAAVLFDHGLPRPVVGGVFYELAAETRTPEAPSDPTP